ncbi:MAG: hypothetical protein QOD42_3434 [Sphingomonadales bacterium]|nr:hypothetical protein [Sphingomonadales bacterium]
MPSILLALLQAVAAPAAPAPADWSALPSVYLIRPSEMPPEVTGEIMRLARVRRECRSSVGPMPSPAEVGGARMVGMEVPLIVLVAPDGRFPDILAAPGPCDAIRNYARALFNRYNRGRVRPPAGPDPAWYRSPIGFSWEL